MDLCMGFFYPDSVRLSNEVYASNFRVGKPFANPLADALLVFRLQTAARDEALHGIQQFQPVFQRRFGHRLPLVKSLRALGKFPRCV